MSCHFFHYFCSVPKLVCVQLQCQKKSSIINAVGFFSICVKLHCRKIQALKLRYVIADLVQSVADLGQSVGDLSGKPLSV